MKLVVTDPGNVIIEKVAGEMAGTFFDAARSSGMTKIMLQGQKINLLNFKTPRQFARRHLEKFIPAAVHSLIEIMSRENCPADQKQMIYDALMERVNDQDIDMMAKTAGDAKAMEQSIEYKADNEKPKPVIINTPKIDFDFDSKRVS